MTIEQIERRLAAEFPGKTVQLCINVAAGPKARKSCITIQDMETRHCVDGRSIPNAIENLKEKLAPVRIGHIEIDA